MKKRKNQRSENFNQVFHTLTEKQKIFLGVLQDLGYILERDIKIKPKECSLVVRCNPTVVKRYIPTFYVEPELTMYDVDSSYDADFLDQVKASVETQGIEMSIVRPEEFPFDEYVLKSNG